jgi:hypothetical protein
VIGADSVHVVDPLHSECAIERKYWVVVKEGKYMHTDCAAIPTSHDSKGGLLGRVVVRVILRVGSGVYVDNGSGSGDTGSKVAGNSGESSRNELL